MILFVLFDDIVLCLLLIDMLVVLVVFDGCMGINCLGSVYLQIVVIYDFDVVCVWFVCFVDMLVMFQNYCKEVECLLLWVVIVCGKLLLLFMYEDFVVYW